MGINMNLRSIVQDYILRIGNQTASQFFGKNISTIKSWRSTGIIPIDAVERVLTELNYQLIAPDHDGDIPLSNQEQLWQSIEKLNQRLANLEAWAAQGSASSAQPALTLSEDETPGPVEPGDPLIPMVLNVPPAQPTRMIMETIPPMRPQPAGPPTIPPGAGMWLKGHQKK